MKVWGFRVRPTRMDRALAAFLLDAGLMGREERRFFEDAIVPGQVVVDVGANQGIFTLLFSRLVGREGRVIALEPAPALFAALEENCRLNAADNVTRLPAAAGERRSEGFLQCSRFNAGDNRVRDGSTSAGLPVEIRALDEIVPAGPVDFVKIDVQGYEMNVVKGMQAIIERSPGIKVFFEYWPAGLVETGSSPAEILDFFSSRGFSLFELTRTGLGELDSRELARSTRNGYWSWRNLLAVRE